MTADASSAPAEGLFARFEALLSARAEIAGYAKVVARPAYEKLLRSERLLRRIIPVLIVTFLTIIAFARFLTIAQERFDVQADAMRDLKVATALVRAQSQALVAERTSVSDADALLTSYVPAELLGRGSFAFVSDDQGRIVAAVPGSEFLVGQSLSRLLGDAQALLMFGERAGVQDTAFDGRAAFVASATLAGDMGTVTFVQPQAELFSDWRHTVSVNVTLFVLTSITMLVVLYAYFRQATRAQDADELYLRTHQRVDTALSRGHCGLWDWDLARGRMYWSRSMYVILGMEPRDGILSLGEISALLHPEDGSLFEIARRIAAGEINSLDRSFRMRRRDGDYVWMRARADVSRTADNEIHLIGVAVDVSEQHEMARRTDEAKVLLSNAVENISETFVLCDAEERLVLCNSKYRETFGLDESDVARGTPLEMVRARARKPIGGHPVTSPTFRPGERASEVLLPDGRWLLVSERRTAAGGIVSIGTDVTQLKLHQARLSDSEQRLMAVIADLSAARRDAERKAVQLTELNSGFALEKDRAESASRAKTTFLANMSHELRTPLNAILGFSEIMRSGTFGPLGNPKYGEYAGDIHQSGHYLLRLIDDILDMAKIEAGRLVLSPEEIDLGALVEDAVKILEIQAEQKSVRLDISVPRGLTIVSDPRATKQIVLNLMSNAVKFTNTPGAVRAKARVEGGFVVLTVVDTGIGIPNEALAVLGRPFEQVENELTRTHKGTGLGLAIARSLTELHGGTFRIASKVGLGTAVTVRLPISDTQVLRSSETIRAA
ncbi:ATP-binding protein [Aurantimonas sp. Leaf443]|uniref:PAS domain-containing sensor histidine kinase n=1 Tax=Aurantimonas sp. Leaf443 TaxID=1736378 RepID=UPI0006F4DB86|nr:ATP-binding protein [Aurantimonas sp. Leaf443]KQT88253.1 PAS domain-containing sensor histidine kinase [Aurantimonas sp. Leaf443]